MYLRFLPLLIRPLGLLTQAFQLGIFNNFCEYIRFIPSNLFYHSATIFSTTTRSIKTLMGLFATLSINDIQHNVFIVVMLGVTIFLNVILNVGMLMLSAVMINVVKLSVVARYHELVRVYLLFSKVIALSLSCQVCP
jgi:hypothetical protein